MFLLENLSWEIFYLIFDYLNTYDLLNSFSKLNIHLTTILNSYNRIQLNFKKIKKNKFDFICQQIHVEQIQSIYLTNDDYTPKQIEIFLSMIPLIKCSNLQSLKFEHINNNDLLNLLISHIEEHQQLCSLTLKISSNFLNKKTERYIGNVLSKLLSLKYLQIYHSSILISLKNSLNRLTHLTIDFCKRNELNKILQWTVNLTYLHISIPHNDQTDNLTVFLPFLKCLIIQSKTWMTFLELEIIFSMTPNLKRLQLETIGEFTLLNGKHWETIIKSKLPYLKQFSLDISPDNNQLTIENIFQSFQTSFWLLEKHWSIACMISTVSQTCVRLFSIPFYQSANDWYPSSEGFIIHSSIPFQFNDYIEDISISHFPIRNDINSLIKLKSVKNLIVYCRINSIQQLEQIMNLSSIQHLTIYQLIDGLVFFELLQSAFNINQLTIKSKVLVSTLTLFANDKFIFEQIKTFNGGDFIFYTKDIDALIQIFPQLEYICVRLANKNDILSICKRFPCLIGAIIELDVSVKRIDQYLEENEICLDGNYIFTANRLNLWID